MTPDQILKLVEAGFTKADILALGAVKDPKPAAAPAPKDPEPAKAPEPAKDPEPAKAPDLEGLSQQLQTIICGNSRSDG